jgi:hypothetical protein
VENDGSEGSYQTRTPYTEGYQQPQMLTYQEEVHRQGDFQEEVSQDGDHQEVEDLQVAEDHQAEECHLFHLPQF